MIGQFVLSSWPNCLLIGVFRPLIFNVIIDMSVPKSATLIFVFLWFVLTVFLCVYVCCSSVFFSCLPIGYTNIFKEFHFDVSIVFLSIFLCVASLVVALGITYIFNLSKSTCVNIYQSIEPTDHYIFPSLVV